MKLTSINVQNFLGVRAAEIPLTKPVTLFAGRNGAGKSSLQEAVRMALTGETVRVGLKKEYGQLVTEGAQSGFAEIGLDGSTRAFVTLPDGKSTPLTDYVLPTALPYVLDAQSFAALDANARRAFLFGLMGLSAGGDEVKKRLLAKGCDVEKVEAIVPLLRSGFDAGHKEAQAKARDEKAAWRTITGETYGDKKAASWAAEKPAFDAAALADLQQRLAAYDTELATANQRMGALQADHQRQAETAQRLAGLRQKASVYARVADKLARDEAELKEWQVKVIATRQLASSGRKVGLVHDLAYSLNESLRMVIPFGEMDERQREQLADANVVLEKYSTEHGSIESNGSGDIEARNKLPEYEKALRLLQSAVANDKRDLAEADAAAKAIAELEAAVGSAPDEAEIHAARKHLDDLKAERSDIAAKLAAQQDAERQAKQADERTTKALAAHESVLAWIAIADALAPDGIPGEMLAEALDPINDRLEQSSQDAEWPHVHVEPDMSVWAAYPEQSPRPYALLSESEKWRADAMLAEAIAYLSKIGVLVLDRLDVLDLKGREDLIAWLDILAQNGEINTALIFGTLKALPATLPKTIAAHWLENGVVAQLKEAA
ncbi:AAA family ATPase [Ralstonia syzygii]|uniref:AAA family ATPase n=1 Tax=Ralstonia syzygii TaxID=28097 RepID=UPI0018D1B3EE|nr:AAA family ATPase [Ralstonia syzygii]